MDQTLNRRPTGDRRKHQRLQHQLPARVQLLGAASGKPALEGEIVNLSISGLAIRLQGEAIEELEKDLPVRLDLRRTSDTLTWPGYLRHLSRGDDGSYLLGIEFESPNYQAITGMETHREMHLRIGQDAHLPDVAPWENIPLVPAEAYPTECQPFLAGRGARLMVAASITAILIAVMIGWAMGALSTATTRFSPAPAATAAPATASFAAGTTATGPAAAAPQAATPQ